MAKYPQRREMILHALQESRLEALASFFPTEVLLLTGYSPVIGASLAVCTRQGNLSGIAPKDELELAETTSHAELFAYEPQTLRHLISLTEAKADPVTKPAARLHLKPGDIGGVNLGGVADGNALPHAHSKPTDILEAGMTFNSEPAIYLDGVGGMRHCDTVACTQGGAEVLTDF